MRHHRSRQSNNLGSAPEFEEHGPAHIDLHVRERLRAAFSDVLNEPIPERFANLLDRFADGQKR
jgi:hypothetical protein